MTDNEQGRYVCTAHNVAGTVTAVASLVIQGAIEWKRRMMIVLVVK